VKEGGAGKTFSQGETISLLEKAKAKSRNGESQKRKEKEKSKERGPWRVHKDVYQKGGKKIVHENGSGSRKENMGSSRCALTGKA